MSDLISRSGLIEAIKRQYCKGCDNYNGSRCRACHADDMLSLVDDAADAQRWISVEERLPEVEKLWTDKDTNNGYKYSADLLVYDGVRIRVAYYCHTTTWWYDSRYEDDIIEVTHWMSLPKPPKEV